MYLIIRYQKGVCDAGKEGAQVVVGDVEEDAIQGQAKEEDFARQVATALIRRAQTIEEGRAALPPAWETQSKTGDPTRLPWFWNTNASRQQRRL